jgi:hypothetical protein
MVFVTIVHKPDYYDYHDSQKENLFLTSYKKRITIASILTIAMEAFS